MSRPPLHRQMPSPVRRKTMMRSTVRHVPFERVVDDLLQRGVFALAIADIRGEDQAGTGCLDPVGESACAPKPAKTTTWIAPMRTAASISMIASGQGGM